MLVTAVKESSWDKDGTSIKVTEVTFDDKRVVPGYDLPQKPEVGKPLPNGWEIATSKKGKSYIKVPRSGGGGGQAAFRNTKEGQAIDQERMDRRTALMQAVTLWGQRELLGQTPASGVVKVADALYDWLRTTSQGAPRQPSQAAEPAGERSSSAAARVPPPAKSSEQKPDGEKTGGLDGSGTGQVGVTPGEASAPTCPHLQLDPLKPDGRKYPRGYARCTQCGDVLKVTA